MELRGVELRGFWCGTEGVLVLNLGVLGVELRGFWCGAEHIFYFEHHESNLSNCVE